MQIQYLLELTGTGLFAISGAIAANKKSKPDWFGVTFIGFITSIGGGSIRDILLGSYPLSWVADEKRIYVIIAGIVFTSLFFNVLLRLRKTLFIFDSLGIAMFTILGTEKALAYHVAPFIAAIMGMFSAIMGGVMRDVLTNEIPVIFRKEIYASACLAGALVYLALNTMDLSRNMCLLVSVSVIFGIRVVAVKYRLSLPQFKREKVPETDDGG
ncbi:trimeric intracellular cation channel family protein [Nemorincola caseinilytica]|uniref:Trimeric intracellular cation channel family protein n=1 Tax=Nemorincola caseinilytica TaxID=2054315 RepID=A0ABP8NE56_9BACT